MELEKYKEFIKIERKKYFSDVKPYDLIYNQFVNEKLVNQSSEYFFENASEVIEILRDKSWSEFQILEKKFTSEMLLSLDFTSNIEEMTNIEAVTWFVEEFPLHIYNLNLSNTQSRRSRAGKEFEAIIELILIGANIPMDSQGNIGKKVFIDKGLGKIVDIVSPGSVEYVLNKRDTILISAKTTLRERWQEVPEEMGRTGAREMFLVTLDDSISKEVMENLNNANIQVVTTSSIKNTKYEKYNSVISFEKFLLILKETTSKWNEYNYSEENVLEIKKNIEKQVKKHSNHPFVKKYYEKYLNKIK